MAPGGGKRKRNDRVSTDSVDGGNRPSPHRPQNSNLAREDRQAGSGGQRRSTGGRNNGPRRTNERRNSHSQDVNSIPVTARTPTTPGPMSPPPTIPPPSRTQTPTPTTTPAAEVSPEAPRAPRPQYNYEYVTEQRLSAWKGKGRQEIIDLGKSAAADEDLMELSMLFQELIHATVDRILEPGDAGGVVMSILGEDTPGAAPAFDPQSIFLDCLSIITEGLEGTGNDQLLFTFITATGIMPSLMRQKLDGKLLQNLGLTRNTFIKVGIRKVTNLLYRQANYNLLREESEGYSKLVTELFSERNEENVGELFEKVKGLIGTFDLDVGRVLDVTLDVFASLLVKQNRFFIKFLRRSSWWPRTQGSDDLGSSDYGLTSLPSWALPGADDASISTDEEEALLKEKKEKRDVAFWNRAREVGLDAYFELGGRRFDAANDALTNGNNEAYDASDLEWIKIAGTVPPSGSRTAAQLLGFKLRFYCSDCRDPEDKLPANLIYLSALMIKIGFISLRDLYAHLWPLDEAMNDDLKEKRIRELQEKERLKRAGDESKQGLANAAPLTDDTVPRGREPEKSTVTKEHAAPSVPSADSDKLFLDPADVTTNQKVQLLTHLLIMGALPESLFMLGKYPWLLEAYPDELIPLIHRILHHSIQKLHDASQPLSQITKLPPKKYAEPDLTTSSKGRVSLVDPPEKRTLRWAFPDKFDTANGQNYTFYWTEWANNVPICQTLDDLFTLCSTFLNLSGVNIGKDSTLLCKIARIGNHSLINDRSKENLERWQDLLKRILVPALSLTQENPTVVNEVYDMLRHYSVKVRYTIYAEWYGGQISRLPAMAKAFNSARRDTEQVMKRISKTNVTEMARKLSKIAYSSPGTVFKVALGQIEAYSNLVEVVVECARYFTDLGYDVLVWTLMSFLGQERSRKQANGMTTSAWLQALALFSGKAFKRYSIMNVTPILQYVNDQLCQGNSSDLIVLEEITTQMAGIVSDIDFTNAQLEAMTGGEVLRRQTLINLQDKRHESAKTAKRLIRALVDSNLAPQLLISIAQHRQKSAYDVQDEDAHTKLIATLTDETQRIFTQFLELLRSNLSNDDFDRMVPDVIELMADYGLEPEFAFLISRTSISKRIEASLLPKSNGTHDGTTEADESGVKPEVVDSNGDSVMKEVETAPINSAEAVVKKVDGSNGDTQMVDAGKVESPSPSSGISDSYNEVLAPIVNAVKAMGPSSRWTVLSPEFYVTFWQLSVNDLSLPLNSYEAEIARLTKEQADLIKDRSDMSRAGMNKKDDLKRQITQTQDDLRQEIKQQIEIYGRTKARLMKERLHYFGDCHGKWDPLNEAILEQCLLPRALLSPTDAIYCFQMIKFLHSAGTPNFRTLGLQGKIFSAKRLRLLIFQCSIREAENLGRFLKEILTDLSRWHAEPAVFEKEALGPKGDFPGFAKLIGADGKPKTVLSFEDFRRHVFRVHKGLYAALRDCLNDTEWTHVRNAITILKKVHEVFPAIDFMGKNFITLLTDIGKREKDKRGDLSLSANALLADLKKREKAWVIAQAFSTGADPSLDRSSLVPSSRSKLKPTAPEFKPKASSGKTLEVEDGEVKDAKTASTSGPSATAAPATGNTAVSDSRQATKPEAPASVPEARKESRITNPPPRSDHTSRNPAPSASQGRGSHQQNDLLRNGPTNNVGVSLPVRPDPPPRHGDPRSSIGRPSERRDARDSRNNEGRLNGRDHSRDYGELNRRGPDQRSFEDRNAVPNSRHENAPPQWAADVPRDPHVDLRGGRGSNGTRTPDYRLPREPPMVPPRSSGPDRPIVNPDRMHLVNADRQEPLHPERAALISGATEPSRSDPPRMHRDDRRERDSRPGSRPQSPRRGSERSSGALSHHNGGDHRRDELANTGRLVSADSHSQGRGRHDDPMGPGPRSGRNFPSNDRLRESFQNSPAPMRPVDPDHGRLVSTRTSQPDPNFGRLNAAPEIPSGPRGRESRPSNRSISTPQPRGDSMSGAREPIRPPTPEKLPPTGPSSDRANTSNSRVRRSVVQVDTSSRGLASHATVPSSSSTPASPSIHPDRLRHLSGGGNGPQMPSQQPPSIPSPSQATAGVHPDRLRQLQSDESARAPPLQPSNSRAGRGQGPQSPLPVNTAPRGPRNQSGVPSPTIGSHGFAGAPPTGPADRGPRDRNRGPTSSVRPNNIHSMISDIIKKNDNSSWSSTNDRMSIRGHSDRMSGAHQMPTSNAGGPSTAIAAPRSGSESMPPRAPPAMPDMVNAARADLITGGRGHNGVDDSRSGSGREHHDRRSRHRRSSRSRSPKRSGAEEERASRGSRNEERRGGNGELRGGAEIPGGRERENRDGREREREPSRRSGRDSEQSRSGAPPGGSSSGRGLDGTRDPMSAGAGGRDLRDSTSRREERGSRDSRGGGEDAEWNRRNELRDAERGDRRSSRGTTDGTGSARKRRGDEQIPGRGDEKRPRQR